MKPFPGVADPSRPPNHDVIIGIEIIEGTREHHTRTDSPLSKFVPTFQKRFCRLRNRFELAFTVPGGRWSGMPVKSSGLMRFLIRRRNSWLHRPGDVDRDVARFDSFILPTQRSIELDFRPPTTPYTWDC